MHSFVLVDSARRSVRSDSWLSASAPRVALLCAVLANETLAQTSARYSAGDSAVVRASGRYGAGRLHRRLLGDGYRDLWGTPIAVPVLDLGSFAGGLHPTKTGGGGQTKNLRLETRDGREYVFRPVFKSLVVDLDAIDGTILMDVYTDTRSHSHPTAPVVAPPFLSAAGIPHPRPRLVVMPDDSRLGEFRADFAGLLGTIEEYPSVPDDAPGFAGAEEIIDSEELVERLNEDPRQRIDARALLAARLVDFLLGDIDRHGDQWKWARMRRGDVMAWVPIPRDRDKALVSYDGFLFRLARLAHPSLVSFESTYPPIDALSGDKVRAFDERLLGGLERAVWDSITTSLVRSVTDSVIDGALRSTPREYQGATLALARRLRARRDALPDVAAAYYEALATWPVVHATNGDDRARVTRAPDGKVEVTLRGKDDTPYFRRRFDSAETREIRIYLHDGDDSATVVGAAGHGPLVRIVGGNGNNVLIDSSSVHGREGRTFVHDAGEVRGVRYGVPDTAFDRRPWVNAYGRLVPPSRDQGTRLRPRVALITRSGLGIVPKVGARWVQFGFRTVPYKSAIELAVQYSTTVRGMEVDLTTDNRFESSRLHVSTESQVSQLQVGRFVGFGNEATFRDTDFFDVRQTQWSSRPALAFALGEGSDLSIGPIVKHTSTDRRSNRLISELSPYGFSRFGQMGAEARLTYDSRDEGIPDERPLFARMSRNRSRVDGFALEVTGNVYPATWDVSSTFGRVGATLTAHRTLPLPTHPVVAMRAGGERVFGTFPYFEAAFLGGSHSLRTAHRQRYAGDASLHGSTELRVPVRKLALVLPLDLGLIGFADGGRVYMDGDSPGGWHAGAGGGFWIGLMKPETNVNVLFTNSNERRVLLRLGFDY